MIQRLAKQQVADHLRFAPPPPAPCPHCLDPFPGRLPGFHLAADAPTPQLEVGQVVIATRPSGVCAKGEPGVVVEAYTLDGRSGWLVQFEHGGVDGWTPCEVNFALSPGQVEPGLRDYEYRNRTLLRADWTAGRFAAAFQRSRCADPEL